MKKIISLIIGIPAFYVLLGECEDLSAFFWKSVISGGILAFLLYINGAFRETGKDTE